MFCDFQYSDLLYTFFNNATTATILAVLLAGFIAVVQYKKQKKIDRDICIKRDIVSDLIFLKEETHCVLLTIDRIANSYKQTTSKQEDFWEDMAKYEIPGLSKAINGTIPSLDKKLANKLDIYFEDNEKIKSTYEELKSQLKKWHDPIVKMKISLRKKVEEQPELSLKDLEMIRVSKNARPSGTQAKLRLI